MARLASIANAGFEPVPEHMIPAMASLVEIDAHDGDINYAVLDPCAGEGAAIVGLAERIFPDHLRKAGDVMLFACELEKTRAETLEKRKNSDRAGLAYYAIKPFHGDAFALTWTKAAVSLAYLNPPFDTDKSEARRMEERFLRRFVPTIHVGGVLMFVLPYYALKFSAETVARNFRNVQCVRFPDWDFDTDPKAKAYKRVVLVGERIPELLEPDARVVADMLRWSEVWQPIPDTWSGALVKMKPCPDKYTVGFDNIRIAPLDVAGLLAKSRPWHSTDRGGRLQPIQGIVPDKPAHEGLGRVFPVVLPMKPAYLAAGIAAGVFNGERIVADDPTSGMPDILVKGVFKREFVHAPEEDKHNKDGDKTQETHVQQPELVITVLDLSTKRYSELKSSVDTTGATSIPEMSVGDLLLHYGKSMMASLRKACPVLHEPARDPVVDVPGIGRKLYQAQAHAVTAALKLLGGVGVPLRMRAGQTAYILGEVGVGKTGISLATAVAMGAKRVLVMCPPITVPVWQKQVTDWFPDARSVVLETAHDVHALADDNDPRVTFAIVSRETAKLGHAWAGVGPRVGSVRGEEVKVHAHCPSCHAPTHAEPEVLASKRASCFARERRPLNRIAHIVRALAHVLAPVFPNSPRVSQAIGSRTLKRMLGKWQAKPLEGAWERAQESQRLRDAITMLFNAVIKSTDRETVDSLGEAFLLLLVALGEEDPFARAAKALYLAGKEDTYDWTAGGARRRLALRLLACCEKEARNALATELRSAYTIDRSSTPWARLDAAMAKREAGEEVDDHAYKSITDDGYGEHAWGEKSAALAAVEKLSALASWGESDPCGEPLYQAIPEPRRVALAPYIAKKFPKLFEAVIFDEFHELSNSGDSAQSKAMARLAQLGLPTLALTGSLMNGYAKSIFAGQWALDLDFRREFDRNQEGAFVQRYGYLKIKVEYKDKDSGKTVMFGAVSDRVERTEREAGSAPGILPLFVLQYLLRRAVVIHKEDLNIDLPPNYHFADRIACGDELFGKYRHLSEKLRAAIKRDMFGPLAGKLFGQTNRVVASLDMLTDDVSGDSFDLRYPDDCGGGLVASEQTFCAQTILPKEAWILETTKRELAEGRNVLIYAHHTDLLPRLRRLVQEQLGEPCAMILASESDKVEKTPKKLPPGTGPVIKLAPKKREPWIEENITGKIRVLVINSSAVQVGLNSLVWFNTIIWTENPACNPIAFRQANGRIYRPGQKKETRVYFPVYEKTAQAAAHSLLMQKVAVSEGTDGLDARGALAAAGVGSQAAISALSVGKQLYAMMDREEASAQIFTRAQAKKIVTVHDKLPSLRSAQNPEQIA